MDCNFNYLMPTIYIGDNPELFLKDYTKMDLLDTINMSDTYEGLKLEIKSDGTRTETNFKIKKNNNKGNKRKAKEDNIDIINNKNKNNNKIIKKKEPLSVDEKRARNKIAAQKCRKKKQLKLEETLKLVATLRKELEEANEKINQLKQIIHK